MRRAAGRAGAAGGGAGQARAGLGRAGHGRAGHGRARQGRARQGSVQLDEETPAETTARIKSTSSPDQQRPGLRGPNPLGMKKRAAQEKGERPHRALFQ